MTRFGLRFCMGCLALATVSVVHVQSANAWSHQGHILMTRLACLHIINDPAAPAGLKAFLQNHMKFDLDSCRRLATEETVGFDPQNYQTGLDNWCTMPDRIKHQDTAQRVDPFDAPEAKMHYIDLEYFGPSPVYKDDLSNKPKLADVPNDPKDFRYRLAGYAPLRIADVFNKLAAAWGPGEKPADEDAALKWAGYLAHYVEDSTQPHHATIDFKSLSYLAGHVKGVNKLLHHLDDGKDVFEYRIQHGYKIDPHGAIEYQLFENADEPRKTMREKFWKQLIQQIDILSKTPPSLEPAAKFDPFTFALESFLDSYDNLPLLGHAAQAGYANDTFDVVAFFNAHGIVRGRQMSTLDMLAIQNAKAVLAVEKIYHQAWQQAHPTAPAK